MARKLKFRYHPGSDSDSRPCARFAVKAWTLFLLRANAAMADKLIYRDECYKIIDTCFGVYSGSGFHVLAESVSSGQKVSRNSGQDCAGWPDAEWCFWVSSGGPASGFGGAVVR